MRVPTATELLRLWEQGVDMALPRRALLLVAAACPEASEAELARIPIGRRDQILTELRTRLFGSAITLIAHCPRCSETLETDLRLSELRLDVPAAESTQPLEVGGYRIAFRTLTAGDLFALPEDAQAARCTLLSRCVLDARASDDTAVALGTLPAQVITTLTEALARADPGADLQFTFSCPGCAHEWSEPFDITSALWKEIHAWAQRALRDIHTLARAYGWREKDILALSPTRRQIYLELNQA